MFGIIWEFCEESILGIWGSYARIWGQNGLLSGIEDDGNRAVVDEVDFHMFLEEACFDVELVIIGEIFILQVFDEGLV